MRPNRMAEYYTMQNVKHVQHAVNLLQSYSHQTIFYFYYHYLQPFFMNRACDQLEVQEDVRGFVDRGTYL